MAVFGFGRRNAVGRQYNGGNVSVMLPRYTTPPERNTRDWLEMFGRNPRLAVVDRIASDLSTCAGKLYRKDENGEEVEITDHPFLNFMAHPNPLYEMTSGACWRLQQIYLELKGEGYFVYEFDALGRPVELWPLPTHWVQQTPYVGYPYYEIRTTGGLIRQIPVDDIFCMKELNPLDPYKRGLGAAESLADEIETDEYAAKFQKKFFYNDATPTTLISMPGSSKDQRDRFRSEWNELFRGPFNSHGIATVDGNVTVTKLAENMRDMDMTEGRRFLRDAVLEHFGVPREIMGITESSNRATSEAAQYIYAQNVIMPRLNRREEAINTQILPFYGNDLVWHFDDVVPRSQEFDKAKGIDGWNAGLLTKDEARELLGMEPCKTGGDCFKITISDMFIGSNDDPAEVTTDLMQESTEEVEVTDDEDTGGMLSMSDRREHEEKSRTQNIGNLLAAAQKAQRAKFEVATMKFFRQQQKRLSGSLSGTEKADWSVWDVLMPYITENHVEDSAAWSALGEQEQKNLVEQFIGGLVNWPSEETAMEEIFNPLWKQTYADNLAEWADAAWVGSVGPFWPESVTWKWKVPDGVSVADLRDSERDLLEENRVNFMTAEYKHEYMKNGICGDGNFIDNVLGADYITHQIRENLYEIFIANKKIAYTDDGFALVAAGVFAALNRAVELHIIATDPEDDTGVYTVVIPKRADATDEQARNRQMPDIKWSAQLEGAVHSVKVNGTLRVTLNG